MKRTFVYWLALALFVMMGCQKEVSFEVGNNPSDGSLQSDVTGDCLPKTVNGTYVAATALVPATDNITVSVNVTKTGVYVIASDTVNGYFFRATGIFTALGTTSVTLRGNGTPFAAGINNFVVSYDSTICDIAVTVLPAGTKPSVYTLEGAPGNCTGAVVNGSYATSNLLNFTNTVKLNVNVTTIGTYNISTTKNGMTFSKSGSFTATGVQSVTLDGAGTPTINGDNVVPITVGTTTCSFTVPVGTPAVGTLGGAPGACTPATVNGTYTVGTVLTTANSVQIQVTVTTLGLYTISTNTVAGIRFAASGSFTVSGPQSLTLNGTGTPTASGNQTFTVTFGTSSCTFTVNVLPVLSNDYYPRTTNSNWSYETDDDPNDSLYRNVIAATLSANSNVYNIFLQKDGITPPPDSSGYYRKSGGDYFEWIDIGNFIGFDPPAQWKEYVLLKDNVAAGINWKSAGYTGTITAPPAPPQSVTLRFSYTILQKDVPITLATSAPTVTYSNVIVVEEKYEILVPPSTWQDATSLVGYSKSYYARGIGLIKIEFFGPTGSLISQTELRRYQIF